MGQKGEDYEFWLEGVTCPSYPALAENLEVDTLIVGGGITGVFSAYELTKAGVPVALIDKARLGEWATDCTTGFLTQSIDTSYRDLKFAFGQEGARQVAESHRLAIERISQIITDENIVCDFESVTNRILARTPNETEQLERELSVMRGVGIKADYQPVSLCNSFARGYLEMSDQATYQPMKFLTALAEIASRHGAKIYEQTEAFAIKKVEDRWQVKTGNNQITAKHVIIATYSPWHEPWHLYFKKALYRSYVLELEAPDEAVATGLYEDLAHPYHYSRVVGHDGKCQIIFGGEDHRLDLKISRAKNYAALLRHAEKFFSTPEIKVVRRWSGQLLESIDGLPYIGEDKKSGLYYAFAFSGNGLTYSAIAASLFSELITNKVGLMSPFKSLYRVNRWPNLKALLIKGRDYGLTFIGGALKNIFS
jgi:glycine/D-amino acid oxidase-like deaminating enzyme